MRRAGRQGAYRIGIAIESRTGPGESLPAAFHDALSLTWEVTSDTVRGIGHLATGRDTNQVSSSFGIVRVSAAAWRQGLRDFLFVLGLISLALGLLNLLPVLPLDGGHIVMALLEKVRGRTFRQARLHALHRRRPDALRGAHVLRPAQRHLRRRRLSRPAATFACSRTWALTSCSTARRLRQGPDPDATHADPRAIDLERRAGRRCTGDGSANPTPTCGRGRGRRKHGRRREWPAGSDVSGPDVSAGRCTRWRRSRSPRSALSGKRRDRRRSTHTGAT